MSSIDSFLFTAEITVLFVANRQWSMSLGTLRYGDQGLRTTNYGWTSVVLCLQHWAESCKYRTLRLHYSLQQQEIILSCLQTVDYTREEAERETTRKDFLVFMFSSEKCKYFACDLIFRIMNKFFHTSGSNGPCHGFRHHLDEQANA